MKRKSIVKKINSIRSKARRRKEHTVFEQLDQWERITFISKTIKLLRQAIRERKNVERKISEWSKYAGSLDDERVKSMAILQIDYLKSDISSILHRIERHTRILKTARTVHNSCY